MTYDSRIHHRRTIRLSGWDYSADGAYFVTVCTDRRAHLFGDIVDGHMRLNAVGAVVADTWRWLSSLYPYVTLGEWCVMPNHLHGLLVRFDQTHQPIAQHPRRRDLAAEFLGTRRARRCGDGPDSRLHPKQCDQLGR